MVIYGVMGGVSIGALFIGGILPGILMGLFLMIISHFISKKREYSGRQRKSNLKELLFTIRDAFFPLLMPLIIVGGIIGGIFTATESAVIAVVYALILGLSYRSLNFKNILQALIETGLVTGSIIFIVASASLFTWILTINQIPQTVTTFLMSITNSKTVILILINVILLIVGTFIDTISALIIFTPLFLPIAKAYGIDLVHLGVIIVLNLTIGMCTPPLGVCLFVAAGIAKIPLSSMMRDLVPLILFLIIVLCIVTYIPQVSMYLPDLYLNSLRP
jgi:C4-dicarboxylate transporter DctM subunit